MANKFELKNESTSLPLQPDVELIELVTRDNPFEEVEG